MNNLEWNSLFKYLLGPIIGIIHLIDYYDDGCTTMILSGVKQCEITEYGVWFFASFCILYFPGYLFAKKIFNKTG